MREDFRRISNYKIDGHVTKSYIYDLIDSHDFYPVQKLHEDSKETNRSLESFNSIITKNDRMLQEFNYISKISKINRPVLILGETGSGKELFAESVHLASGFKGQYVTVNVAGLDGNSFSDTLFGHVKGAYTGADALRKGLIKTAEKGSIFLDEIGDLDNDSQI